MARGHPSGPLGRVRAVNVALFSALTLLTLVAMLFPGLHLLIRLPRARIGLETLGLLVAVLAGALAFLRYSLSGVRSWLFIGLAFTALGLVQMVFGVFLPPDAAGEDHPFYAWSLGRLAAGGLLLAGSLERNRRGAPSPRPTRTMVLGVAAVVASVGGGLALVFVFAEALPAVAPPGVDPDALTGAVRPELPVTLLGVAGTLLYLAAGLAYLRPAATGRALPTWLGTALVLGAFSHVHFTLVPTVFSTHVSSGDLLRLAFVLVVLAGLVWDIGKTYATERSQARELARSYLEASDRVQQVEAIDRARAELFQVLTHELMNPVAALRGLSLTAKQLWDRLEEEERREIVDRIEHQTANLATLAEEAGSTSALEAETFAVSPRPERLVEIVRHLRLGDQPVGDRLRIAVRPEDQHMEVRADPVRIQQVLGNLLSNAAKYGGDGAPVDLRVEVGPADVTFSVADRGPGIAAEDRPKLFQKFSRLESAARLAGSGLGLYISRRIVEEHGGTIGVRSTPGQGATFWFTLPRAAP